jgi:predicted lipoprotein with Yx(FWY)xxD motif
VERPGQFVLVTGAGGVKQITYDGYPLYVLKGAKPFATDGNGGSWHVVPLSASDIRT